MGFSVMKHSPELYVMLLYLPLLHISCVRALFTWPHLAQGRLRYIGSHLGSHVPSYTLLIGLCRASLVGELVKNLPAMQETWVQSLGWEDPPGEGKGHPLQYSFFFFCTYSWFIQIYLYSSF